jgi:hypothetical protein
VGQAVVVADRDENILRFWILAPKQVEDRLCPYYDVSNNHALIGFKSPKVLKLA